jgi:hypothetical protein
VHRNQRTSLITSSPIHINVFLSPKYTWIIAKARVTFFKLDYRKLKAIESHNSKARVMFFKLGYLKVKTIESHKSMA